MEFLTGKSISNLEISFNPNGWGPVSGERIVAFDEVPYAHFDKKDKITRPADFAGGHHSFTFQRNQRYARNYDAVGNADFAYRHDAAEDSTFHLVDSSKTQSRSEF